MVDFDATLLSPLYACLAVDAILTLPDGTDLVIYAIDKTAGVELGNEIGVPTVLPAAAVRRSDLIAAGVAPEDLINGTASFNGFTWTIRNFKTDPNPSGEAAGEVLLLLNEPHELTSSS